MTETAALNTKQEEASPNGHDTSWQSFDDDGAFLQHIISKAPAEQLEEVPEWGVKVLCKALHADGRIAVSMAAYDETDKTTDWRRPGVFPLVVFHGCYNPITGNPVFAKKQKGETAQARKQREAGIIAAISAHGGPVERLGIIILRLSGMLSSDVERAKKN